MQHLLRHISKKSNILVACSGGVDSVCLLSLMNKKGFNVSAIFIDHFTETSEKSLGYVRNICTKLNITLFVEKIEDIITTNKENLWREQRYKIFDKYVSSFDYIALGHHLDDQIENYVISMINGYTHLRLIKFIRDNKFIRPLLLCKKEELYEYCQRKQLGYYDDPTNYDDSNLRSKIRNNVIPMMKSINPGLDKAVIRLTINSIVSNNQ